MTEMRTCGPSHSWATGPGITQSVSDRARATNNWKFDCHLGMSSTSNLTPTHPIEPTWRGVVLRNPSWMETGRVSSKITRPKMSEASPLLVSKRRLGIGRRWFHNFVMSHSSIPCPERCSNCPLVRPMALDPFGEVFGSPTGRNMPSMQLLMALLPEPLPSPCS